MTLNAILMQVGLTPEQVARVSVQFQSKTVFKHAVEVMAKAGAIQPRPVPPKPAKLTPAVAMARRRAEDAGKDTSMYPARVKPVRNKRQGNYKAWAGVRK